VSGNDRIIVCPGSHNNSDVTYGSISDMSTLDPHPGHAGLFKLNSTSAQYSPLSKQEPAAAHEFAGPSQLSGVSRMRTGLQITNMR